MTDQRERILTCACELYLDDGFEGFSMRKLARAVGVTAPALYRHYDGKEKVLLDVVGEAHKVLGQYLYASLSGETARERFQRAGQAYMEFALDHPRYFQMIHAFTEFMGLEEIPEEVLAETCAIGRFWDDRVRECMEAGVLKLGDPQQVGLALWAHAYGLISLYLRGLLDVPEEIFRSIYSTSFRRILVGLATEELAQVLEEEAGPDEPVPELRPHGPEDLEAGRISYAEPGT
jgi:AcrR family transcriptional regulator